MQLVHDFKLIAKDHYKFSSFMRWVFILNKTLHINIYLFILNLFNILINFIISAISFIIS